MSRPNLPGWQSFLQSPANDPNAPTSHPPASPSSHSHSHSHTHSHSHSQPTSAGLPPQLSSDANFDVVKWHPSYQSCQSYFVNHAQFQGLAQSVAAFTNIRLPFQWTHSPISQLPNIDHGLHRTAPSSSTTAQGYAGPSTAAYGHNLHPSANIPQPPAATAFPFVSLVPYIRRLIVTGFDQDAILHGFFGNDWREGIGPLHEIERRNYMFSAKSVGWADVKRIYDIEPDQTVPFMQPLQRAQLSEIKKGEIHWSEWLAMEDWMIGPMAPDESIERPGTRGMEREMGGGGGSSGGGAARHEEMSMMMQQDT